VAEELKESFIANVGMESAAVIGEFKGSELELVECGHPFVDRFRW
jgi:isoleucyl-tRNA synthetase